MMVLVVGASARALQQITAIAPAGVRITSEAATTPDWVLVATSDQRVDAIRVHGLRPFRVVEIGGLDRDDVRSEPVRAAMIRIAEIGASRPLVSPTGIALVTPFIRRMMRSEPAAVADG